MRCVEHCLEGFPDEMTAIWSIARGLTAPWGSDKNEDAEVELPTSSKRQWRHSMKLLI